MEVVAVADTSDSFRGEPCCSPSVPVRVNLVFTLAPGHGHLCPIPSALGGIRCALASRDDDALGRTLGSPLPDDALGRTQGSPLPIDASGHTGMPLTSGTPLPTRKPTSLNIVAAIAVWVVPVCRPSSGIRDDVFSNRWQALDHPLNHMFEIIGLPYSLVEAGPVLLFYPCNISIGGQRFESAAQTDQGFRRPCRVVVWPRMRRSHRWCARSFLAARPCELSVRM